MTTNRHHLAKQRDVIATVTSLRRAPKDEDLNRRQMTKQTVLDPGEPGHLVTTGTGRIGSGPRDRRGALVSSRKPGRPRLAAAAHQAPRSVKKPRKGHRGDDPDRKPKRDPHLVLVEEIPINAERKGRPVVVSGDLPADRLSSKTDHRRPEGDDVGLPIAAKTKTDRRHLPREAAEARIREIPRTQADLFLHLVERVAHHLHDWTPRLVPEARRCRHQEAGVGLRRRRMMTTDPLGEPAPTFEAGSFPNSAAILLGRVPLSLLREGDRSSGRHLDVFSNLAARSPVDGVSEQSLERRLSEVVDVAEGGVDHAAS